MHGDESIAECGDTVGRGAILQKNWWGASGAVFRCPPGSVAKETSTKWNSGDETPKTKKGEQRAQITVWCLQRAYVCRFGWVNHAYSAG